MMWFNAGPTGSDQPEYNQILVSTHLLVGGGGFIGRHVAILLLAKGCQVILADRESPEFTPPPADCERLTFLRTDVVSADWDRLIEQVDVVHYYAWSSIPASANANPLGDLSVNLGAILGLLEAMRRKGGGRVVFSSCGGTVYGRTGPHPIPEGSNLAPITAYGAGKVAAEVYLNLYRELHGLDCRIARIANPYGAGQDTRRGLGAVTTFLRRALDGDEIVIWGDGGVQRDYVHITDVARALVALSLHPKLGEPMTFNIGSGQAMSLNAILQAIEHCIERPIAVRRVDARSFDVPVNVLDIQKARTLLNWSPRLSFVEGLRQTLDDLQSEVALSRFNDDI